MKRSKILGLEGAVVNQEGAQYCLFLCTNCPWIDKKSYCLIQLGPPNPLDEYMSQFSDTVVASQTCKMELFDKKLIESTIFGDHNLVHSIRIVVCNKRYPCMVCHIKLCITGPCDMQETSHFTVSTSCYAFDKCCWNYGSTSTI